MDIDLAEFENEVTSFAQMAGFALGASVSGEITDLDRPEAELTITIDCEEWSLILAPVPDSDPLQICIDHEGAWAGDDTLAGLYSWLWSEARLKLANLRREMTRAEEANHSLRGGLERACRLRRAHRATVAMLRRTSAENERLRGAVRSLRARLAVADADRCARRGTRA